MFLCVCMHVFCKSSSVHSRFFCWWILRGKISVYSAVRRNEQKKRKQRKHFWINFKLNCVLHDASSIFLNFANLICIRNIKTRNKIRKKKEKQTNEKREDFIFTLARFGFYFHFIMKTSSFRISYCSQVAKFILAEIPLLFFCHFLCYLSQIIEKH